MGVFNKTIIPLAVVGYEMIGIIVKYLHAILISGVSRGGARGAWVPIIFRPN